MLQNQKVYVFIFGSVIASLLMSMLISTSTFGSWGSSVPTAIVGETSISFTGANWYCPGNYEPIRLRNSNDYRRACVYGATDGVRLARYVNAGYYLYAVQFPNEATFTQLRGICEYQRWCSYGQAADALLAPVMEAYGNRVVYVQNFTKHLELHEGVETYYQFNFQGEYTYIGRGDIFTRAGVTAVSQAGRWGVVELEGLGFVRIDLQTGAMRRIVAATGEYWPGPAPAYELAISDDGTFVSMTGYLEYVTVYRVDSACGDVPDENMQRYFSLYTHPCDVLPIDTSSLIPGYREAHSPRFSSNGSQLSVVAITANGEVLVLFSADEGVAGLANQYFALGDSFTSGEGELDDLFYISGTNTSANPCHVSSRSYPYLVGQAKELTTSNRACSGARMADVALQSLTLPVLASGSKLTVSVGGNDIGLMGKLKTCLSPGTCEWANEEKREATVREIDAILPRLSALVLDIHRRSPAAEVSLIGYPSVVATEGDARCSMLVASLLTLDERRYLDESVRRLNQVMRAAAQTAGVEYVDIESALEGERLCEGSSRAMNDVRFGDDIAPLSLLSKLKVFGAESFHPTPKGHEMIASTILATAEQGSCELCSESVHLPPPTSYWTQNLPSEQRVQRATAFLDKTSVTEAATIKAKFPAKTFKPGASVRIELHSDTKQLGEWQADAEGALDVALQLVVEPGYHAVHAFGESWSNELVDLYEVVEVTEKGEASLSPPMGADNTSDSGGSSIPAALQMLRQSSIIQEAGVVAKEVLGFSSTKARADEFVNDSTLRADRYIEKRYTPWVWIATVLVMGGLVIILWICAARPFSREKHP